MAYESILGTLESHNRMPIFMVDMTMGNELFFLYALFISDEYMSTCSLWSYGHWWEYPSLSYLQ